MADIIPFPKSTSKKKKSGSVSAISTSTEKSVTKTHNGNTLCKSGFHKWKLDKNADFAVKQGKLLTHYVCERCQKTKTETS